MKIRRFLLLATLLSLPATAGGNELLAQYDRPTRGDESKHGRLWGGMRWHDIVGLRGGGWYSWIDGELRVDKAKVMGDPVDLGPNLGLESPAVILVPQMFAQYEWKTGAAIRLEASYFWNRFEGEEQVEVGEEFTFEGWPMQAGTSWDSELDVMQGKLNLRFTPYVIRLGEASQLRISLYGGGVYMRWIIRLKLKDNPGAVGDNRGQIKDEFGAMLGHIGSHIEYRLGPLWIYGWASGIQFDRNELSANYFEAGGGIKIELAPFLLIGAEVYYLRARLDRNDQYRFDFSMYGPSAFISIKY